MLYGRTIPIVIKPFGERQRRAHPVQSKKAPADGKTTTESTGRASNSPTPSTGASAKPQPSKSVVLMAEVTIPTPTLPPAADAPKQPANKRRAAEEDPQSDSELVPEPSPKKTLQETSSVVPQLSHSLPHWQEGTSRNDEIIERYHAGYFELLARLEASKVQDDELMHALESYDNDFYSQPENLLVS